MNANRFLIPPRVGRLLQALPSYPGSALFAAALNLALTEHLPEDVRQALTGRMLRIAVTDARLCFDFSWNGRRFVPCRRLAGGAAALTIAASAHDFLLLARREEDPDTLFFSRRLSMEGDTELGLLVKNTLDAIESPVFKPLFEFARKLPAPPWSRPQHQPGE